MMFRLTTIVALVGLVSANSYSIGCMNTLLAIGNNPDASCIAPNLLLPILVGAGNSGDSVVSPIDAWITGMCGQPACSSDVLGSIIKNVTAGCSAEFGLPQVQDTLNAVTQGYATFRSSVCLKDGQTNCVTQTLKNMESAWGTMTLNDKNIGDIANGIKKGLPSSVLCTDCMKGMFTLVEQDIPGTFSDSSKAYATKTCGDSFTDGGLPPNLFQSAVGVVPEDNTPAPVSSSAPTTTSSATSTSVTAPAFTPTSSVKPKSGKKNSALGRASAAPLMNLAASGLVIVFSGMVLL